MSVMTRRRAVYLIVLVALLAGAGFWFLHQRVAIMTATGGDPVWNVTVWRTRTNDLYATIEGRGGAISLEYLLGQFDTAADASSEFNRIVVRDDGIWIGDEDDPPFAAHGFTLQVERNTLRFPWIPPP